MKFTIQELKDIINEELENILEQSEEPEEKPVTWDFPPDAPFVEYEEAKDDSEAAILPQLYSASNGEPVFFVTKIREKEYRSVYTGRSKPNSKDAGRYQKMGIGLIWANSRYGIGNWSPKSIIGIHRHAKQMRQDGAIYGNYNYMPENIDEMIEEEIGLYENERRTGTLQIGMDNNFGPVLVFILKGEGQVVEVFSSKLKLSNEWVNAMAAKQGKLLGDAFSDAPAWFARKFPEPYNDPEKLAGLEIVTQSSWGE